MSAPQVASHRGHSPKVWLPVHKPFNRGAEFWEILEVFRKLSLTGLLVFVTDDAYRAVTAVLLCVVSVANLNYLRPQVSMTTRVVSNYYYKQLLSTVRVNKG